MMNYDEEIKEYILDYYGVIEDEEELERIKDDLFIIEAQDDEELAYKYIDDICGGLNNLDRETLERYFDFEAFGRDLSFDFTQTDNLYICNH